MGMNLVYVGVLFCAVAFAIFAIFMSVVLKRASTTMKTLGNTLGNVEEKLNYLTPELRNTVNETEKMVDDLHDKLSATDNLVDSIENIGTSFNTSYQLLDQQTKKLPDYKSSHTINKLTEGFTWGGVTFQLYKRWKYKGGKNELAVQNSDSYLPVEK